MGWSIGYSNEWCRDIGYGVPAYCDHPRCNEEIDRGLSYVCGGPTWGADGGCGLYFCDKHLYYTLRGECHQLCSRCFYYRKWPFNPKPDHPGWIQHKLTHESWEMWRDENPAKVAELLASLKTEVGV